MTILSLLNFMKKYSVKDNILTGNVLENLITFLSIPEILQYLSIMELKKLLMVVWEKRIAFVFTWKITDRTTLIRMVDHQISFYAINYQNQLILIILFFKC